MLLWAKLLHFTDEQTKLGEIKFLTQALPLANEKSDTFGVGQRG